MLAARLTIGVLARGVMWACLWFIVGNAVAQCIHNSDWVLAFLALALFPLTFFIYPFAASPTDSAWPVGDDTALIVALAVALIAYPISTFVGGLDPVDR